VIIPRDNLIFVHIQKTGGTAINRALGVNDSPGEKHRTSQELHQLYGSEAWERSFKFSFVRNPWDRLVSWWSMINAGRGAYEAHGVSNGFFRYVLDNATTFDEFLANCTDEIEDVDGKKCIFKNQLDYLTDQDGTIMVDFIGRFESLVQDFSFITTKVYGVAKPLPVVNASEHEPYQAYYTPQTRKLVQDAYGRDLAHFGFTFD
jgi:Sulfotransferase family